MLSCHWFRKGSSRPCSQHLVWKWTTDYGQVSNRNSSNTPSSARSGSFTCEENAGCGWRKMTFSVGASRSSPVSALEKHDSPLQVASSGGHTVWRSPWAGCWHQHRRCVIRKRLKGNAEALPSSVSFQKVCVRPTDGRKMFLLKISRNIVRGLFLLAFPPGSNR